MIPHEAYSITQTARRFNVSIGVVRRLIRDGKLTAHRVGNQWRVFEADLQDYLERNANQQQRGAA
jgi:excisionase family DNA binding protein